MLMNLGVFFLCLNEGGLVVFRGCGCVVVVVWSWLGVFCLCFCCCCCWLVGLIVFCLFVFFISCFLLTDLSFFLVFYCFFVCFLLTDLSLLSIYMFICLSGYFHINFDFIDINDSLIFLSLRFLSLLYHFSLYHGYNIFFLFYQQVFHLHQLPNYYCYLNLCIFIILTIFSVNIHMIIIRLI